MLSKNFFPAFFMRPKVCADCCDDYEIRKIKGDCQIIDGKTQDIGALYKEIFTKLDRKRGERGQEQELPDTHP